MPPGSLSNPLRGAISPQNRRKFKMAKDVGTYTIRLCIDTREFEQLHNVAEKPNGGRFEKGDLIGGWRILGVRGRSLTEDVVDVEKAPQAPCEP
jgi:hypothetical protein